MKQLILIFSILCMISCSSEQSEKTPAENSAEAIQSKDSTLSQQMHAPIDTAKNVEALLQLEKDRRDALMQQQTQ